MNCFFWIDRSFFFSKGVRSNVPVAMGFKSTCDLDPLFFTSSIFLNTPQRVAAMAMMMGLCLLVYSLGQRSLRQALNKAKQTVENQVGKSTAKPTLRWMFQCFMSIHLLTVDGAKHVTNLTTERLWILQFFGAPCRKYYLLS